VANNYKQYGDFILDMNQFVMAPPKLPRFNFDLPNAAIDYNERLRLDDRVTFPASFDYMRVNSFRLNGNLQLNLYGEYDANGRKIIRPSALPWEKNDFKGGFELKSNNGHFGIRFEVQRKANPYAGW
jgi:hypothetical protein